jgi:uncharacterized membrane protein YdjX (TVP38/TMEM64 family)
VRRRDDVSAAPPTGRAPGSSAPLWTGALALAALFVAFRLLPVSSWLEAARLWIAGLGAWGPVAFVALYVVATLLAAPAIVLTLAAGPLFGPAVGVAAVSAGATLGATAAFAVARWVARDRVARRLEGSPTLARLDRLAARRGWAVVAITRLVPLFPFNLLNYAFGLTGVRFSTYVWASWLFMLPGTALYVLGGDALLQSLSGGGLSPALLTGVALALLAVVLASRGARRWLARVEAEDAVTLEDPR